jgi:putative ABC transport system permease protein
LKSEPPYQPGFPEGEGWLQIVGIVTDALDDGLRNPVKPAVYVPYALHMAMFTQILVRTRIPPMSLLHDVRAEIVQIDRNQQVKHVRDLESWITGLQEYSQQRPVAALFGIFSVLALALAVVGLYSVVSYSVATRTNEFGIRINKLSLRWVDGEFAQLLDSRRRNPHPYRLRSARLFRARASRLFH